MNVKRADLDFLHYNGQGLMKPVTTANVGKVDVFGPDPLECVKINFGNLQWENGNANVDRSKFLSDVGVYASSKFLDDFLSGRKDVFGETAEPIP